MMMLLLLQIVFVAVMVILSYTGQVYGGCTDVAEMCIWDTDQDIVKVCKPSFPGSVHTICRRSGTYNISYEFKVYTTNSGFNPCFENGIDCPEIKSVNIKTCRTNSTTKSSCIVKNETTWRYFSYGNRVSRINTSGGVGDVFGRPYIAGTYNITTQVIHKPIGDSCDTDTIRTIHLILRPSCQGNENYVLTG